MKIELHTPLSIYEIGKRPNQEDALAQWDNRLFVLCDGMGGHEKGEVASQTVCQAICDWFSKNVKIEEPFTDDQLKSALAYAYDELDKKDDDSPKKMGTTLTLLYIHRQGVTAAHIGDSRIYHIRSTEDILYQSRDHSLVYDLYQSGEITFDEMATHPQKNVITRAMQPGEENRVKADIIHITDIKPGDYFYMCSDGMLEQMSNEGLTALLASDVTDEEKHQQLISATSENSDNHTAWIIHIKSVLSEEEDQSLVNEEPTARCNAMNIKPQPMVEVEDVITNEDDNVVLVSTPQSRKTIWQKIASLFKKK